MARIPVVDDEPELVRFVARALEGDGHQVSTALDGGEGLRRAVTEAPDLVVLDLVMAGVAGRYFDGTTRGLTAAGLDLDAISVQDGVLSFSTLGNVAVVGVAGTPADADVYTWDGSRFARAWDASVAGLPGTANLDGWSRVAPVTPTCRSARRPPPSRGSARCRTRTCCTWSAAPGRPSSTAPPAA